MLQETLSEVVLRPSSFTLGGSGQDSRGLGVRSCLGVRGKCTQTQSHPQPRIFRSEPGILSF